MPTRDASSPVSFALSRSGGGQPTVGTSAAFNPPDATLLRVSVLADTAAGITPTLTVTNNGAALTWATRVARGDSEGTAGFVSIAETYLTTGRTGMTVTASVSNSYSGGESGAKGRAWVDVWTGAAEDQSTAAEGEGSSTTNNITPTALTTTAANSRVTGIASDWNALGAATSTDEEESIHIAGVISGLRAYKAADTATASAVTLNFDANGTGAADWNWVAAEILAAGGGQTVIVGQSEETNSAFAVTAAKTKLVGLNTETDSALAIVVARFIGVELVEETDTPFALAGHAKAKTAGQSAEADSAFALVVVRTVPVGLATETDSAFSVSKLKRLVVGLATEVDAALAVQGQQVAAAVVRILRRAMTYARVLLRRG